MTVQTVPLKLIAANPHNVRRDVGDVTELADSIRGLGLLEPLIVAPAAPTDAPARVSPGTPYVLIAGHRRLAACKQAGIAQVDIIVRDDLTSPAAQLEAMLVENLQRVDITAVEEGQAYKQLLAFDGITVADIAKKTGRSPSTVKSRVTLTTLPDAAQDKLHGGELSLTDALSLAEFADDPAAVSMLEESLGSWRFEHELSRLRRAREAAKEEKKTRAALKKAGVTVIDRPADYPHLSQVQPIDRLWWLDEPITAEQHATCPGHAAVIGRTGEPDYVCIDPDAHHPRPADEDEDHHPAAASRGATRDPRDLSMHRHARALGYDPDNLTDEQRIEVDAAVTETARVRQVLDNAVDVRNTHVDKLLAAGRKAPDDTLGLFVGISLINLDGEPPRWALDALDTPIPAGLDDDSDELVDWFLDQVRALPPARLARLALRSLHADADPGYPDHAWGWTLPACRAWFNYLTRTGYPISPEEQAKAFPPAEDGTP